MATSHGLSWCAIKRSNPAYISTEISGADISFQAEPSISAIELMIDVVQDSEAVLNRFNKLIQELLGGNTHRNTFRPWEIAILLDIEACSLRDTLKKETLRRYQKAVQRAMERGAGAPLKLSEYLDQMKSSRPQ